MQMIGGTNLSIKGVRASGGYAYNGGAIYLSGGSSLYIEKSIFSFNYAHNSGGAISADSFELL